ncbi:MAG TPA: hypothetical protein PLF15_00350 [bacterium]|nr:hypothetical protein [bacterium]
MEDKCVVCEVELHDGNTCSCHPDHCKDCCSCEPDCGCGCKPE